MLYLDASAMIKLILEEAESDTLRDVVEEHEHPLSSELLLAEMPRALRRRAFADPSIDLAPVLVQGERYLAAADLLRVTRSILGSAGALAGAPLRALDAIHVATAVSYPGEPPTFVSYDERQLEAAAGAGLAVAAPGR